MGLLSFYYYYFSCKQSILKSFLQSSSSSHTHTHTYIQNLKTIVCIFVWAHTYSFSFIIFPLILHLKVVVYFDFAYESRFRSYLSVHIVFFYSGSFSVCLWHFFFTIFSILLITMFIYFITLLFCVFRFSFHIRRGTP